MKKIIKKMLVFICSLLSALLVFGVVGGIYISHNKECEIITDGVVRLNETTKDNGSIVSKVLTAFVGNYEAGRCSAATKTLVTGDTIVGRNLDNTQSNYPIFVGSTNIEGFYKTVYVTQLESLGPEYDDYVKNGIPRYMECAVPFLACDSLNSEGLYAEINMRANQKNENGDFIFSCSGTNPNSDIRLNVCELPTYLTLRCKNVSEAVELINTIDVYTANDEESWTLCLMLCDASGKYGVLEFACNETRWLPNQNIQTNYYLSQDLYDISIYKQGLGRYEYLEEHIDNVQNEDDMLDLLKGVKYSEIYNIDNSTFDIRSEFAGDEEYLTNSYLENDENWAAFLEAYKDEANSFNQMSIQEKKDANYYWISLYTSIVNCNKKTISLSFFEEYEITYILKIE